MKSAWPVPFVLLFSLAPAAYAKVGVDYDKTADFTNRKTYAWKTGSEAPNPLTEEKIRANVDLRLRQKGLQKTDGPADLIVLTHALQTADARVDASSFYYGGYHTWDGWYAWGPASSVQIRDVATGSLIVDILDGGTEKLIWRGVATKTFSTMPMPETIAKKVESVVKSMFAKFPPPPPKKSK